MDILKEILEQRERTLQASTFDLNQQERRRPIPCGEIMERKRVCETGRVAASDTWEDHLGAVGGCGHGMCSPMHIDNLLIGSFQ